MRQRLDPTAKALHVETQYPTNLKPVWISADAMRHDVIRVEHRFSCLDVFPQITHLRACTENIKGSTGVDNALKT